jgi:hypothetical protein
MRATRRGAPEAGDRLRTRSARGGSRPPLCFAVREGAPSLSSVGRTRSPDAPNVQAAARRGGRGTATQYYVTSVVEHPPVEGARRQVRLPTRRQGSGQPSAVTGPETVRGSTGSRVAEAW